MNPDTYIPPQSKFAEDSLIASLLVLPDLIPSVIEKVAPSTLYGSENRSIYEELIAIYDDGRDPDIVSISENLKNVPNIELHLSELLSESATTRNLDNIIAIINDRAARRKIVERTNYISLHAQNTDCPTGDTINKIESLYEELEEYCNNAGVKRRRRGRIVHINDIRSEVETFWLDGKEKMGMGFSSWPNFSKYYRLVKGTVNVLNGIPTHGKTSLIDAMVVESIIDHDWKWAIFSPENKPYYLHIQPLTEKLTGKPFFNDGCINRGELDIALDKLQTNIVFLEPDSENRSMAAIKKLMTDAIKNDHVQGIILDPWNKIEMVLRKGESETQYTGRTLLDIQYFARSNNVFVGIVAHPTKMYKAPNGKKYPVPTLYDLHGGANWYNGVDNGLTIYRDFKKDYIELHIQKIKFKNHGEIGTCFFRYEKYNGKYFEIDRNEVKKLKEKEADKQADQEEIWQNKF